MDISVLGSVRVTEDDASYYPAAPKPRQLLALFALNAGRPVSVDSCVRELWSYAPPRTANSTVHTYVMQIRKCMAQIPSVARSGSVLTTLDRTYKLDISTQKVDLYRFRDKAGLGRQVLEQGGNYRRAVEHFESALIEWNGDMLEDVRIGPLLELQVVKANQERITIIERSVEARLQLGMHHDLIHELAELVHQYPTNENLVSHYMIALYRSDRQVDALNAYRRLQMTLDEDLAIRPSPRLRELHRAILNQRPDL